jgi:hypothetical protein
MLRSYLFEAAGAADPRAEMVGGKGLGDEAKSACTAEQEFSWLSFIVGQDQAMSRASRPLLEILYTDVNKTRD